MDASEESIRELEQAVAELRRRQSEADFALGQTLSRLRAVEQRFDGKASGLSSRTQVRAQDIVGLLNELQEQVPALEECRAVEVSIQDESAEESMVAGAAFFGDRMSSAAAPYRSPNDAWIHIDFTADWKRAILFESAVKRLQEAGLFILVTDPKNQGLPQVEGLEPFLDANLDLCSGRPIRVCVWKK